MVIKGIIFDFGGVIMRTEDRNPRSILAKKHHVTVETIEHLVFSSASAKMAEVGSISASQHWQEVAQALHIPESETRALRRQFFDGDRIDGELVAYIRSLRQNYRTALLSNAFDDLRTALSGEWCIPDSFDEIIISAEIGVAKPHHRIYQIAAEKLQVKMGECVFIDDFPSNVESARLAGMEAIRFMSASQVRQDLEAMLNSRHAD